MAQGLQIFDASGNVIMDTNTRVSTVLGSISVPNTNGYVTHPLFSSYPAFYSLMTVTSSSERNRQPILSLVTVGSEVRLTWTWATSGDAANKACTLFYGVY